MDKKKFQRIGISIFIISFLITPVNSLDTGDLKPGFNEVSLSFNISIKLWGYDELSSNLSRELSELLPNSIITESEFPPEGKIDQYVILANQAWFGIKNKISYNIEPINIDNEIDYLTSRISYFDNSNEKGGITGFYYDKGNLKNQTGYVIDSKSMGEVLKNFNTPTGYTLHLLNLTRIDNFVNNTNSKHWYRLGDLQNIPVQSDIRNVGVVGSNGLFYDPSASAPAFDSNYISSSNFTQVVTTLSSRITDLVENVFIGTPYAFNYNSLEEKAYFDLVIIGNSITDSNYLDVRNQIDESLQSLQINDDYLSNALSELLPYLEVETNTISISLDQPSNIVMNNTIAAFEQQSSNGTGKYIKVTTAVAEKFKKIIRENYHPEWPTGFYYALFVFVDSDNRQIIWDVNGLEEEYTYGKVGFSTINLAEWKNSPDKSKVSLKQRILQGFGNMVGIPTLENNFSNQVNSVMSTYGITDEWDTRYNQFEIDNMARRVGNLFYISTIFDLKSLRNDLKEGMFRWLDRSSLDDIELLLRQGNIEFEKGNYSGSTKLYMEGYFGWLDAKEELVQKQRAFYYGIQLAAGVIVLLYLISTLKLFTITKDELYEKYDIEE